MDAVETPSSPVNADKDLEECTEVCGMKKYWFGVGVVVLIVLLSVGSSFLTKVFIILQCYFMFTNGLDYFKKFQAAFLFDLSKCVCVSDLLHIPDRKRSNREDFRVKKPFIISSNRA